MHSKEQCALKMLLKDSFNLNSVNSTLMKYSFNTSTKDDYFRGKKSSEDHDLPENGFLI